MAASEQELKQNILFILIRSYDFSPHRTNNTCEGFLIFQYSISYVLFLKIALNNLEGKQGWLDCEIER